MNTRIFKIGGSIFALALVSPAIAADTTLPAKNASGTTVQLKVQDDAGTLMPAHTVRCAASPSTDCVAQPQAVAGSDASTAIAVQGISGGKAVPVSASSLPLPTGAATAAKQPALGTAGTASSDVITVQGIASGTNLNVNCQVGCSGGTSYTEDAAAAADPVGLAIISRRRDTMSTSEVSADGDNIGLISTNKGELRINDNSLNTAIGTTADSAWASGSGSAIGLLKTIATASLDTTPATVNITQVAGASIAQGNGTAATAIRVALPTDGTGVVGLNAGTNLVGKVGLDQTTPGTTNAVSIAQIGANTISTGNGATGTGSPRVTIASDNTPIQTRSAGVSTPARIASAAATTNLTEIADSGGCRIVSIVGAVARTSAVYLKLYNAADQSVTVGTTTPYVTIPLPAGGTNPTSFQFDVNQVFASGACSLAMTTAVADNSTAALTAADVVGLTVIWGTN